MCWGRRCWTRPPSRRASRHRCRVMDEAREMLPRLSKPMHAALRPGHEPALQPRRRPPPPPPLPPAPRALGCRPHPEPGPGCVRRRCGARSGRGLGGAGFCGSGGGGRGGGVRRSMVDQGRGTVAPRPALSSRNSAPRRVLKGQPPVGSGAAYFFSGRARYRTGRASPDVALGGRRWTANRRGPRRHARRALGPGDAHGRPRLMPIR